MTSGEIELQFRVHGEVRDESGRPVFASVAVEVSDLRLGGEFPIGIAAINSDGTYELSYDPGAVRSAPTASLDLVVRVIGVDARQQFGVAETRFEATRVERVDIVVDSSILPDLLDEYSRIVEQIRTVTGSSGETIELAALVEDGTRRDVTFISAKSGAPARAVAMVTLAERESARTGIPAPLHFALYRAGLPAGSRGWALASDDAVRALWLRAIDEGIVAPGLREAVPTAMDTMGRLGPAALLDLPIGVDEEPFGDFVAAELPDEIDRARFAALYRRLRDTPAALWAEVAAEFPTVAAQLELRGSLATLTGNNAALINSVCDEAAPSKVVDLVQAGYHRAAQWQRLLTPDVPVPPEIGGTDDGGRRAAYAQQLAEQLGLLFPTAVIAADVADGLIPVDGPAGTGRSVTDFLCAHDGFELSVHPIDHYLSTRDIALPEPVRDELATLQRITAVATVPSAVRVLREIGFTSARAIAQYSEADFVARHSDALGGDQTAAEILRRSEQVHTAALGIATSCLVANSAPQVYAVPRGGPTAADDETIDMLAVPALESLFGQLDSGTCSPCESVLSPAAYLVDLLEFLNTDPAPGARKPLDVLLERRPDLQHISLSCENTEIELPYVDIANEILEHVVVNRVMTGYRGHDVAPGLSAADLMASPQFVNDAAYTTLRDASSYPLALPWDQRLAALRGYLAQLGLTLGRAMAVLAPDQPGATNGRTWQDVVRERLGTFPAEVNLLTNSAVKAQALFGNDPQQVSDTNLVASAANARRLARRFNLTPAEVVELVATQFVSPDGNLLVLIDRLGVNLLAIQKLHDGGLTPAKFKELLPHDLDTKPFGGDVVAWLAANHDRIMNTVTLTDPTGQVPGAGDSTSGFAAMELRRALPDSAKNALRPVDLLGIARFLRLRARLGWSIGRTDEMLAALWHSRLPVTATVAEISKNLDEGFGKVLVRLGHLLTAADLLDLDGDTDLPWLLGCFAPLAARGPDSAFRRLFPGSALFNGDPVFGPGPDGIPPTDADAKLVDHGPALQAALKLTADELTILFQATKVTGQTPLSVATVSNLFRYGFLARALELSVGNLVAVIDAAGLKPFDPLDGAEPDFLRLIRLVQSVAGSGLPIERLVELTTGRHGIAETAVLALLVDVRAALSDPGVPAVPIWTESALRTLLTSAYDGQVADRFLALLAGIPTYQTAYRQDSASLPSSVRELAPGLSFDVGRALLIHRGVLTAKAALKIQALHDVAQSLIEAVGALAAAGQAEYQPFLQANPILDQRWQEWSATPDDPAKPNYEAQLAAKRTALGTALLDQVRPELRRRRFGELLATTTGTTAETITELVHDRAAMPGSDPQRSVGDDLLAATTTGFSVSFWRSPASGAPAKSAIAPTVDYGSGRANLRDASGIATGPITGTWSTHITPAVAGGYAFSAETDGTAVSFTVNGVIVPVRNQGKVWTTDPPVNLGAESAVRVDLRVDGLSSTLILRWSIRGGAQAVVPGAICCPSTVVNAFGASYRRLSLALELASAFGLSLRELSSFARSPRYQIAGGSWLSALPIPAGPSGAPAVVKAVAAFAAYTPLRARWAVTGDTIVGLLDATGPEPPQQLIAALAGSTPAAVTDAATHLGLDADSLRTLAGLIRTADLLDLTRTVVLPVPVLSRVIRSTPTVQDVADLRSALRARYDDASWASVVQPIHNELRRAARDALVARALHQENPNPDLPSAVPDVYITAEKLYEKLLIDVQMDPCMTTSRIAQAISTVQLFTARSLINLEKSVPPRVIDAQRWEVMKRYRVWEANRRVFLFPENWLDPELRDDKSPFFRDVESELLQSDITDQAAANALGHYLERLDEVANLEIAGMHVQEKLAAGTTKPDPIVHVIGRTAGAKRTYFHRVKDGTWRAWERVNVDIPDDPVLPVIWKGRLLLFWLSAAKQPDQTQPSPFGGATATSRIGDLTVGNLALKSFSTLTVSLFWSEYYNGRWQSPRTSDPERPVELGAKFSVIGDPLSLRLVSAFDSSGGSESLCITVLNPLGGSGDQHFRLYTTHSLPVRKKEDAFTAPVIPAPRIYSATGKFSVQYAAAGETAMVLLQSVPSPFKPLDPMHPLTNPRAAPFFFNDRQHAFFVQPEPAPQQLEPFARVPNRLNATGHFHSLDHPDTGDFDRLMPPAVIVPD